MLGKTIITGPFLDNGGVAQFVNSLSPLFGQIIIVFQRGKRKPKDLFGFIYPLIDVFRFLIFVKKVKPKKIIINSSLGKVGVFRDGLFIFISKSMGIRTILYIHGFEEESLSKKVLIRFGYFKADKIFVLSSAFKNKLRDLGYSGQIVVSYNPVSDDLIESPLKIIEKFNKKNNLKILMISRIEESKGIFIGLEVFKNLQELNIELHIAGTGSDLERAKQYVKEHKLKKVSFHGFVTGKKKFELLKDSDILLFPPLGTEGLPINILESLAMGLYVMSRPVGGIKDLSQNYHLFLTTLKEAAVFENEITGLINSGLPVNKIKENQNKAKVDFSPKTIFDKVVLLS